MLAKNAKITRTLNASATKLECEFWKSAALFRILLALFQLFKMLINFIRNVHFFYQNFNVVTLCVFKDHKVQYLKSFALQNKFELIYLKLKKGINESVRASANPNFIKSE
jgi:hypothetical protein